VDALRYCQKGRFSVNYLRYWSLPLLAGVALLAPAGCRRPVARPVRYSAGNVAVLRTALGGKAGGEATASAAPTAEPTGWATLRGVFKVDGAPPSPSPLNITSDHAVCMPGNKPVYASDIKVDSSGGIANVVVYLETKYPDGDANWEHPQFAALPKEVEFDQKSCVFLTHVFAIRSSQLLKVLNSDPVGHNTKLEGGGKALPGNFTVPAGASAIYSPVGESDEPFKVSCSIHPWMAAYGLVRKSPYFAVTNDKGEFELANLPAGVPLKFRLWHERTQFIRDAKTTGTVDKLGGGRLQLKLANDEQRSLELSISAKSLGGG
jgi:hypothetical protein